MTCTLYKHNLSDEGRLWTTANGFGESQQVVSVIIGQVCKAVIIFLEPDYIKTPRAEPEVRELIISKLCHNA